MSSVNGVTNAGSYSSLYGKIASGDALPAAADGAAELAISEKMNSQVGGLNQGSDKLPIIFRESGNLLLRHQIHSPCPIPTGRSIRMKLISSRRVSARLPTSLLIMRRNFLTDLKVT